MILRAALTVAPILFGGDKFFHLMVDWDRYLAPALRDFGLFLAAIALSRLATKFDPRPLLWVARGH